MLPLFNEHGYLPLGIHPWTVVELVRAIRDWIA